MLHYANATPYALSEIYETCAFLSLLHDNHLGVAGEEFYGAEEFAVFEEEFPFPLA